MTSAKPIAIVLAAGQGTRMKSDLPKVLCPALGRPMIAYVLDALEAAGIEESIVVVGYRAGDVRAALKERSGVQFALQSEQLGTGHAVMMCREALAGHQGAVLIVTGDSPLIQTDSVSQLLDLYRREQPACILGTIEKDDPHGLGRIVRNQQGEFEGIVEERDADPEQKKIREVNMSTYIFDAQQLLQALDQLGTANQQREYYLTDCPGILKRAGRDVRALAALKTSEALSVNTVDDLAAVEAEMRRLGYPG